MSASTNEIPFELVFRGGGTWRGRWTEEKVTVEVNVVVEGEAATGTLVTQYTNSIEIEADVQSIPEQLTVSVDGANIGTQFTAGSITLHSGVTLVSDPEMLVVNVVTAPTAEDLEGEGAGEAAE